MSFVLAFLALPVSIGAPLPFAGSPAMAAPAERTRIAIHLDGHATAAQATLLESPRRIMVEVRGTGLGDAPGAAVPAVPADGPVRAIRRQRLAGGARFVFDLRRPAVVADGGLDADGRELSLSLQPVEPARFTRASADGPLDFLPLSLRFERRSPYKVSIPVPPPKKGPPLPRVRGDDRRPLVVIDAGHGGVDPGAINPVSHLREKDVTLRIARAIRDELLKGGRVRVALTRDSDKYLVLRERYGIARRLKADLFISIHCDSVGQAAATGASVYTLSDVASDREAARLATRENKADVIAGVNLGDAGDEVSSILIDLTRRETMNNSADFARLLGREAKPLVPMKPNFHRMASLMVLKAPDMPSVLFETGYISNPADAAFLDSPEGRERIAESVRRAVEVHFARRMAAG
jgi:N-acetylmuramoyl-L-alanine amidase